MCAGVQLKAEPIGQTRQMVKDADDVRDFEAGGIVKAKVSERLPVVGGHARGCRTELFGQRTQGPLSFGQTGQRVPTLRFDSFHKCGVAVFDTQKLCVRLRSIVAILGRRGNAGDHFPFRPTQMAGREHNLHEQVPERLSDTGMGGN